VSAVPTATPVAPTARLAPRMGAGLGVGVATTYLSLIVLLPLAALVWTAQRGGRHAFWKAITEPSAIASLRLTLLLAVAVVAVNAVAGTLIAWVLVRDSFVGKGLVDALIDLPFALPTIVAGLTLVTLYSANGPLGVDVAFTRWGILLALCFVTLPFVVRAVQPVLIELDREMEEAAASLGAGAITRFRRIVLPSLMPAILAGSGLAFARAVGEFGSVVLISSNTPYKAEVASVHIYALLGSYDQTGAVAVSIVLLCLSLVVLMGLALLERRGRAR
jgi:sulfate/thiosulfate transport system permease protein